jgi:hypothetical protein
MNMDKVTSNHASIHRVVVRVVSHEWWQKKEIWNTCIVHARARHFNLPYVFLVIRRQPAAIFSLWFVCAVCMPSH